MGAESWWIGTCIAFSALVLSAATLWNGSRKATVELLSQQVLALREEVRDLRLHTERCDRQLAELRDENQWLMAQLRRRDVGRPEE